MYPTSTTADVPTIPASCCSTTSETAPSHYPRWIIQSWLVRDRSPCHFVLSWSPRGNENATLALTSVNSDDPAAGGAVVDPSAVLAKQHAQRGDKEKRAEVQHQRSHQGMTHV